MKSTLARSILAALGAMPLVASAAMLERAELVEMMPNAMANGGAYDMYFDQNGRTEVWKAGTERVRFERDAKERPEGFVREGTWRIKTIEPPKDFDKRTAEEQQQILDRVERGNAELRSVLCWTFAEREKCWDVERTSAIRIDAEDPESELVKTQSYHLYREGRAETRDVTITLR